MSIGRDRLLLLTWLYVINLLAYADRQVLALLKPQLSQTFGWSESDYALLTIGLQVAVAVGILFAGWIIDKVGLRLSMFVSVAGWSVAAGMHALARTLPQFFMARVALGALEATVTPGGLRIVASAFEARSRNFVIGLVNSAPNVSAMITPGIVAVLFVATGWQWTLVILGGAGLLCAVWWLFIPLPDPPPLKSKDVESDLPPEVLTGSIWRNRNLWALISAKAMTDQVWWVMLFWLPDLFHRRYGAEPGVMATSVGIVYALACCGALAGGLVTNMLIRRGLPDTRARRIAMWGFALLALPLIFVPGIDALWACVALVGIALAGHQGFATNVYGMAAAAFPPQRVATAIGIAAFAGNVGGAIALLLAGLWMERYGDMDLMLIQCGLAYVACCAVLSCIVPERRRPDIRA